MATHPCLPLWIDDYDAATAHLTPAQDGVYGRLLRLTWRTPGCSLPNDHAWISLHVRAPLSITEAMLKEFFVRRRRRWFSPAIERWVERAAESAARDRRGVDAATRAFILERDGYRCAYCDDEDGPFHVDHIFPVARGGGDEFENLTCACEACNLSKGSKTLAEWRPKLAEAPL